MMKRAILLILLLATPLLAENDFTKDATCVAWWNFDNDTTYGVSGAADCWFTNWNNVTYSATCQQGDGAYDFESSENDYLHVLDNSLSSDFPCKNGSTNNCFTTTCWVRFEALAGWQGFHSKYGGGSGYYVLFNPDTNPDEFRIGHGGTTFSMVPTTAIAANQWYFVATVFDDPNDYWYIYIWDDTNQELTTASDTTSATVAANTGPFEVGMVVSSSTIDLDGLLDDLRVFSRKLSDAELATVRADTLDMAAEPNLAAWYEMDTSGAVYDSSGNNNHLMSAWGPDTTNYQQGTAGLKLDFTNYGAAISGVADASLPAGFPTKNGDTNRKMTVCYWLYAVNTGDIVGKGVNGGNQISWYMYYTLNANLGFSWGVVGGASTEGAGASTGDIDITASQWYHVAFRYDDDPNTYDWRVWGETEGAVLSEVSGTIDHGHDWNIEAGDLWLGSGQSHGPYGTIDELVFFNDILTDDEIDEIRGGEYGASAVNMWWWRRRHSD